MSYVLGLGLAVVVAGVGAFVGGYMVAKKKLSK